MTLQNRIKELDMLRGSCILAMIAVHFIYDLTELYSVFPAYPPYFTWLKEQGGTVFFLISGASATLGPRPLRRGLQVLGCAAAVSAVAAAAGSPIRFGVLHCLGLCMVLWTFFRHFPGSVRLLFSAASLIAGTVFSRRTVSMSFLYPLGLVRADFFSADYFPLFPFFGFFLAGSCLGTRFYRTGRSLLPLSFTSPFSRFLCLCGRRSLLLYLIHQPVLIFTIEAAIFIGGIFHET